MTHTSTMPAPHRDVILPQGTPRPRSHTKNFSQAATGLKPSMSNRNSCSELDFSLVLYGAVFSLATGVWGAYCTPGHTDLAWHGAAAPLHATGMPGLAGKLWDEPFLVTEVAWQQWWHLGVGRELQGVWAISFYNHSHRFSYRFPRF